MTTRTQTCASQTRVRPRALFCVVEHAYRDIAIAEAVCAGRFTHAGVTLELGPEPDWLTAALPPDAEWRIEWSKFYYSLDLAHAFRATGDPRFPRAWARLVRSWMRQVPVGFDTSDVTARRVQNWIYAWDAFARSSRLGGFDDGFEEELLDSLSAQVAHLRLHLNAERNHRTLELYALFIAALALPELDADGSLLTFANIELHQNLLADIRPDGVHRENSTHYHMLVLRSFLGARENARRFGVSFPEGFDAHLERACEFAMHCQRPDGLIPALSDSDTGAYADILELAARLFSRDDFLYAATEGALGAAPTQRNAGFPDGGYFIQRSDWGNDGQRFRDARFLIFDAGALGDGGHGHYDLLNIEVAAGGSPLVVDPGRFTYSEHGENWRRWFKGTAAHNTVCVDGLDQTPYRRGKPKGETASGRLIERLSAPGLDVLCGEAASPAYEATHTRRIFFVAGEYWLIVDELRGRSPHKYDLRFHLAPEAQGRARIGSNGLNPFVSAPGLALVFDASHRPEIEQGWVSPQYGVKLHAPVVSVVADAVADVCFFTAVVPQSPNAHTPKLVANSERSGSAETLLLEIVGVGGDGLSTDRIVWNATARPFELGPFRGRASAAWLRSSSEGTPCAFAVCNVSELRRAGESEEEFARARTARWFAWDEGRGVTRDEEDVLCV